MKNFPWAKTGIIASHDGMDLRCDYYPRELCRDDEEPELIYSLCRRREGDAADLTPLAIDQALEWFNAHPPPAMVEHPKNETRRALSRPPLERMSKLHTELKAGRFPNCKKLAALLETSPKTIQRDIDFMRDRLGLPIDYDERQWGYFYYAKPECGPAFPLDCLTTLARA